MLRYVHMLGILPTNATDFFYDVIAGAGDHRVGARNGHQPSAPAYEAPRLRYPSHGFQDEEVVNWRGEYW